MHKHTKRIFVKIGLISLCILWVIRVWSFALALQNTEDYSKIENKYIYESATQQNLSKVWVALSTGIWIRFDKTKYKKVSSYGKVTKIGTNKKEFQEIRKKMISQNMIIIKEYLSLLKTDVLKLIENSSNKRETLDTFISQLEIRYKNAVKSWVNLNNQKVLLSEDINKIKSEIETIKQKMGNNFSHFDSKKTLKNTDDYIVLREKYTQNFTDIVFIKQFIVQYNFLNNYNKKLLDTLINNKEALVNKSFIVIPDSGKEFLSDFNLIYSEADFKRLAK